jgi:hypothetical protein
LGVKDSESPTAFHVPAIVGLISGAGEFGAGGADRRTTSGVVPSAIVPEGRPVTCVDAAGFGGFATGGVLVGVVGVLAGAEGVVAGAVDVVWFVGAAVVGVAVVCELPPVAACAALVSAAIGIATAASAHVNAICLLAITAVKSSR